MLSSQQYEALQGLSTPLLADARVRLGLLESHLDPGIRPVVPFTRMVGTAVTVRLEMAPDKSSGDLSLLRDTYASQAPGSFSIIVIQVPEQLHRYGIVGEGAATHARIHGIGGALIEGAARDSHDLRDMEFPVFCRNVSPGYIMGKVNAVPANDPVAVGGRTIHSGDVVMCDNDGVIIVPWNEIGDVMDRAEAIMRWEHQVHSAVAAGQTSEKVVAAAGPMP